VSNADEDRLRIRMAELMSSGGLGYNQISQEILYLLPRDFIDAYIHVWEMALGPAGGGDARGAQLARDANLGKHKTETAYKGKRIGAGGGGQAKRFKKFFVIRDDKALQLKGRMDRRLRNMAREMMLYIDGSRLTADGEGSGEGGGRAIQCSKCGKIMVEGYRFCPYDGSLINPSKSRNAGATNDE
jgi:hypothetical protein